MIRTREEMHHSTGNVLSCPAHPAFTAGCCLGVRTSGKKNGLGFVSVQVSASLHRNPQRSMTVCSGSSRHLQARWEQGPAPKLEGEGQPGTECSLSREGPSDLPVRRRIHWSWQWSGGRRGEPRLRHPDRQSSGKPQR